MYSKDMRRKLRELTGLAAEREMGAALGELHNVFHQLAAGEVMPWDVSDRLHVFHQETGRDIWKIYRGNHWDRMVARAVARGIVTRKEAGADVCEVLERLIMMYDEVDG